MLKKVLRFNGILFLLYLLWGYLFTGTRPEEQDDHTVLAIVFAILMGTITYLLAVAIIRGLGFLFFDVLFSSKTKRKSQKCSNCHNTSISFYIRYSIVLGKKSTCYKCGINLQLDKRIEYPLLVITLLGSLAILHFNFMSCCMDNTFFAIMIAYSLYIGVSFVLTLFVPLVKSTE